MIQTSHYKNEVEKYYNEAVAEFDLGHYHLVVGHLNYALYLLDHYNKEDNEYYGEIYKILCRTYMSLKQYDKAEDICSQGILYYQEKDRYQVCYFFNQNILINMNKKKYYKAKFWYERVMSTLTDVLTEAEVEIKVTAIYNLAACYLQEFEVEEAKQLYVQAFKILGKHKSDYMKGRLYLGLGYIYHLLERLDLAEKCYLLCKSHLPPKEEVVAYGRLMHNLAEIYESRGFIEKARESYLISIEDEAVFKLDKNRAAAGFRGIASTYKNEDIKKVQYYCNKALNLMMSNIGVKFMPMEEQELGQIYLLFSYWLKQNGNLQDCKIYLKQAERIFKKYNLKSGLKEIEEMKSYI